MELFKTVFLGKNNVSTDIYIGGGGGGKGIGMCAKGYSFLAFLVCKRVSILTISVWNNVWFVPSRPELFLSEATWSDDISLLMFTPTIYVPQQYSFVSYLIQRINITFNIRPT